MSEVDQATKDSLSKSALFAMLTEKCKDDKDGHIVLSLVEKAATYASQRTKTVLRHMGEFTLHDSDHLFQVLEIIELLLGDTNIRELSTPELMLLIVAAFFHDIGMAPDEKDVQAWLKNWDSNIEFESDLEENQYLAFRRFTLARPERLEAIEVLTAQGEISRANIQKSYLVSDYIRDTHSIRAREIIERDWAEQIMYRDTDLTVDLAEICFSHNEDALSLLNLDMHHLSGHGQYSCLPMVGVLLRIADILDFDPKRTPDVLLSNLNIKNPISLLEWKKHRDIQSWEICPNLIQFHAKCRHPAVEYAIHQFCDLIDRELGACNNVMSQVQRHLHSKRPGLNLLLPLRVDRTKIETQRTIQGKPLYLYRDTKFSLSKKQVIELLMGTKLYGNPEVALRELLQNSIDACLLRDAMEKKWQNPYRPQIIVRYLREGVDDILEVEDNGIGMDQQIIDNYYSNIGKSFYKSTDFFDLKAQSGADFQPTSRFGIGILSCFMVSDTLIVDTKKVYAPYSSTEPLNITIEGQDSIFWIREGQRLTPGTKTRLILRKKKNPWEKQSADQFIQAVENVVPNPPFQIVIESLGKNKERNEKSFGTIDPAGLKNHSWNSNENLRELRVPYANKDYGILGTAIVALLESQGRPVSHIETRSKKVEIDEVEYELMKSINLNENEIELHSTSITIDDDGNVTTSTGYSPLAKSQSRISLHGIEIPVSLFPETWRMQRNQARLQWPFPVLLVIDICGQRDLDLNSARNQIVLGDKWVDFEENLARLTCESIRNQVGPEYWASLQTLLQEASKSEVFTRAIEAVP